MSSLSILFGSSSYKKRTVFNPANSPVFKVIDSADIESSTTGGRLEYNGSVFMGVQYTTGWIVVSGTTPASLIARSVPVENVTYQFCYALGKFMFIGYDTGGNETDGWTCISYLVTSTDGVTWTKEHFFGELPSSDLPTNLVAISPDLVCLKMGTVLYTSTNRTTWTSRGVQPTIQDCNLQRINGLYVALNSSNNGAFSSDGFTWTQFNITGTVLGAWYNTATAKYYVFFNTGVLYSGQSLNTLSPIRDCFKFQTDYIAGTTSRVELFTPSWGLFLGERLFCGRYQDSQNPYYKQYQITDTYSDSKMLFYPSRLATACANAFVRLVPNVTYLGNQAFKSGSGILCFIKLGNAEEIYIPA